MTGLSSATSNRIELGQAKPATLEISTASPTRSMSIRMPFCRSGTEA